MKTNTWLVVTLSLTVATLGSSAFSQAPNDLPPPLPVDSTPKGKPAKPAKKAATKTKDSGKGASNSKFEAKPLTAGPAVVQEKNVNVRGKAAITSEVIAHLKRGDRVQVIEEVTLKNPKTDEPSKWAKIALPANAPVWVHGSFLDQNKTVVPKKLNLRGGPGENYSVIGRLNKGTAVKEVETKGEWVRIEPPAESYAFVAAHLIANDAGAPVLASTDVPKPPVATPPQAAVVQTPPPAPPTETAVTPPATPVVGAEPAGVTPAVNVAAVPAPAPQPPKPSIETPRPVPALPEPEEDVKRVVTREGFVKRSVSIQAPTYFVLENLSNGKTINYLYSPSTNLVLQDFKGKRVMVTGEEMLDERWPHTPVIAIDKLEAVP